MKTAEAKRATIVGIFISLGLLILVIGIFTLGGQKKTFVKSILLRAFFEDIQGLKQGNNVWFLGVKVGTIQKIKFAGPSLVEVEMNVERDSRQFIHKDAFAKLGSDGLIGNKIIIIEGGSTNQPAVENGDLLRVKKTLSSDAILKTLQENNTNLLRVTANMQVLTDRLVNGDGTAGALLNDRQMATDLKSMLNNLRNASSKASDVTKQLSDFGQKLNNSEGLADKFLTDTVIFSQLKSAVTSFQKTASSASELSENLNRVSQKLNAENNFVDLFLNDPEATQKLKNTISNLETSSKKLDENMEALQHNFLLRGFFKKKAKE